MMYNYNVYTAMRQLGVTQLRTKQSKVLSCILQNRDVLVRLCTGGGKSLLFQLPALLDEPGQLTHPTFSLFQQRKDIASMILHHKIHQKNYVNLLHSIPHHRQKYQHIPSLTATFLPSWNA